MAFDAAGRARSPSTPASRSTRSAAAACAGPSATPPRRGRRRDSGPFGLETPPLRADARTASLRLGHLPLDLGLARGRRLARAASSSPRASASSCRRPTPQRLGVDHGDRVAAGADGTPRRRQGRTLRARRAGGHGLPADRHPRGLGSGLPGGGLVEVDARMTVLADVNYFEPWWMQILKSLVIFLVGLQPRADRAHGRAQGARPLPGPLRPQPRRPVRRRCSRSPTSSSSLDQGGVPARARRRLPVHARADPLGHRRGRRVAIIPFGDTVDIFGTTTGLYGMDVSIGPLFVFALGAIAFYGLMLGGWASGSKYSFLGSMRAAAQLISYEVAQGLALVGVIMTARTLSLVGIVEAQEGMWYIVPQFVGFLIFLVASFAETNRAAVRPGRGRRRAGRRLQHRVRRLEVRGVLLRRVPEHRSSSRCSIVTFFLGGWLLPFGIDPPAWVDPFVVLGKMLDLRLLLHLGPRDAAAPALRPADVASAGRCCCRWRRSTPS